MKTRSFLFTILTASLLVSIFAASADARLRPVTRGSSPGGIQGEIVVPAAWSGIWSYVDSTYDCTGSLMNVDTGLDTLCTGQSADPGEGEPFPLQCTGTVDDDSIDMTCVYVDDPIEDCTLTFTIELLGTMSANSYVLTNTFSMEYEGTGKGCDFFPDQCQRTVTRATRIAPEPAAYCATPVDVTSWGRVKSQYR